MTKGNVFIGLSIFLGLTLLGLLVGRSLERFRKEDRLISVKGFCEKEFKSDLVIWSIKVRVTSDDLKEGSHSLDLSKEKVSGFLLKNGINANEIIQRDLTVTDRLAVEYGPQHSANQARYIIEQTLEVRSNNVDLVQKVSRMTNELLDAGVALSTKNDWTGAGLRFLFTKLNDVKPSMLAEATRNAQRAANEFTRESNTDLGKMRKASQGAFSIQDRDQSLSSPGEGQDFGGGNGDIFKKIRVVISVDYSIE